MIQYDWNNEKNEILKEQRNVSFEQVVLHIEKGDLLDVLEHPNKDKYPNQKIIIIKIIDYIYVVPFVEKENVRFLKTIIPNRKLNKKYQGVNNV
jgi:uncharacterized DUF497 family protein